MAAEGGVGVEGGLDLGDAVHDGGVVAVAEVTADLDQRGTGLVADQVHRHLTREDDLLAAAAAAELGQCDVEVAADLGDDPVGGDLGPARLQLGVGQRLGGDIHPDRLVEELGHRDDLVQGPLELADVRLHPPGDVLQDIVRHCDAEPLAP